MKNKSKLLISTITAAMVFAGGLAFPHSSNVEAALKPLTNLELNDGEVTGTTVKLRGWALNESGVLAVDVYVDGKYVKTLNVDKERDDVNNAYPGYKNGNISGYEDNIQVTPGTHKIREYAIGNDRQVVYKEASINAKASESKSCLELTNNQLTSGPLDVRGWTINPNGTKYVDIYIDGKWVKTVMPNQARPDVIKEFPQFANQLNCGFEYKTSKLNIGDHEIEVYCVGNDNVNYFYKKVRIVNNYFLGTKMNIELAENQVVNDKVDVRGWVLSTDTIKSVDIYVDGKYTKTVSKDEFEDRPDVVKSFPEFEEYGDKTKCGFDYKLQLSEGKHNITVYAIGDENDVLIGIRKVNVISKY